MLTYIFIFEMIYHNLNLSPSLKVKQRFVVTRSVFIVFGSSKNYVYNKTIH